MKLMPSAMPSTAAVRSERAGLVNASGRNGPIAAARPHASIQANQRPSSSQRAPARMPAAAARSSRSSTPTRAQSNHGPASFADLEADPGAEPRCAPGGSSSTRIRPARSSSSRTRRRSCDGIAADADVAVEQERGPPAAGAGHAVEHAALEHRDRPGPGVRERAGRDVDAEHRDAALGEREHVAAGSAADVEHRARPRRRARVARSASAARNQRARRCVEHRRRRRRAGVGSGESSCRDAPTAGVARRRRLATARANRELGVRGRDGERVGERVDVGRGRDERGPQSERVAAARAGARPVVAVLIATPSNAPGTGRANPMTHQPPSGVRPRTASTSGRCSVATASSSSARS